MGLFDDLARLGAAAIFRVENYSSDVTPEAVDQMRRAARPSLEGGDWEVVSTVSDLPLAKSLERNADNGGDELQ